MGYLGANSADLARCLQVNQGSLYTALHRLEQGWIKAAWGVSELGPCPLLPPQCGRAQATGGGDTKMGAPCGRHRPGS
jgi:hypothetical protein